MSDKKKIYFISGGGTGGHIYPAVSVLTGLLEQPDTEKIYYIGNKKNMEYDIIGKIPAVEFLPVCVSGMPRKFGFGFLKWLLLLEISLWQALIYVLKYKPDAVFTTGGYVSAPVAFIAALLKKPLMIHDCDAIPGLVSRTVAPFADCVSVAFDSTRSLLNAKNIIHTGNPVRAEFSSVTKESARQKLNLDNKMTILVTGGSQGAQTLNSAVINSARTLTENKDVCLMLQTGKKKYDETIFALKKIYPDFESNKNFIVKPYFDDMFYALKAADAVISRAGSLSLSELNLCGAACVLVPYPYAAADHQRKNAAEAVKLGFALCTEDSEFTPEKFLESAEYLIDNPDKVAEMSRASLKNAKPDARATIISTLLTLIK